MSAGEFAPPPGVWVHGATSQADPWGDGKGPAQGGAEAEVTNRPTPGGGKQQEQILLQSGGPRCYIGSPAAVRC